MLIAMMATPVAARPHGSASDPGTPPPLVAELQAIAGKAHVLWRFDELRSYEYDGSIDVGHPDAVVLGGIYRGLMPWLSPPADEELTGRVVSGLWSRGGGRLRASSVAGDAARGAAALVMQDVLADPVAYSRPAPADV